MKELFSRKSLLANLKTIEKEIGNARQKISTLEQQRIAVMTLLGKKSGMTSGVLASSQKFAGATGKRQRIRGGLHSKIVELMKDQRGPMTVGEIMSGLSDRGVRVGGKSPQTAIYVALARHKKDLFNKLDRSRWSVRN